MYLVELCVGLLCFERLYIVRTHCIGQCERDSVVIFITFFYRCFTIVRKHSSDRLKRHLRHVNQPTLSK